MVAFVAHVFVAMVYSKVVLVPVLMSFAVKPPAT